MDVYGKLIKNHQDLLITKFGLGLFRYAGRVTDGNFHFLPIISIRL